MVAILQATNVSDAIDQILHINYNSPDYIFDLTPHIQNAMFTEAGNILQSIYAENNLYGIDFGSDEITDYETLEQETLEQEIREQEEHYLEIINFEKEKYFRVAKYIKYFPSNGYYNTDELEIIILIIKFLQNKIVNLNVEKWAKILFSQVCHNDDKSLKLFLIYTAVTNICKKQKRATRLINQKNYKTLCEHIFITVIFDVLKHEIFKKLMQYIFQV